MQTIDQITQNLTLQPQQAMQPSCNTTLPNSQDNQPSQQLLAEIGLMFTQWKAWFKNKMRTRGDAEQDWGADMVMVWGRYLTAKRITKREFDAAREASFDLDFPPNNAKEFIGLARGSIEQYYPDMRQAYFDAANAKYSHAVCYETASRVGFEQMRKAAEDKTYPLWQKIYPEVCREHAAGVPFSIPVEAQVEHKQIPASREFAAARIAEIRRSMTRAIRA